MFNDDGKVIEIANLSEDRFVLEQTGFTITRYHIVSHPDVQHLGEAFDSINFLSVIDREYEFL